MKPIGIILQTARKEAEMTIEDVSRKTKIRSRYLEFIEKNEWHRLPGIAYTKGFVKAYAETVGLHPEKVLAVFRREFIEEENKKVLPQSFVDMPGKRRSFLLTAKEILVKLFS